MSGEQSGLRIAGTEAARAAYSVVAEGGMVDCAGINEGGAPNAFYARGATLLLTEADAAPLLEAGIVARE